MMLKTWWDAAVRNRLVLTALLLAMIAGATSSNAACDPKLAKPIADEVSSEIAIMVQFTKATCLPIDDGGKCSLLCVSDLRISGDNRNILLTFIIAVAGKKMRDAGIGGFSSILFADLTLSERKRALKLAADRASFLQSGFVATAEKPEVMAARISNQFTEIDFSRK
jgi:hypothetical protein